MNDVVADDLDIDAVVVARLQGDCEPVHRQSTAIGRPLRKAIIATSTPMATGSDEANPTAALIISSRASHAQAAGHV